MSHDLFSHHKRLLQDLYQHCAGQPPFNSPEATDTDRQLLDMLSEVSSADHRSDRFTELGQTILTRIVGHYPHITPAVSRDLFWFFGGDCLHYMGDEEIERYQRLDELLYEKEQAGEPIDFAAARATVFQLH